MEISKYGDMEVWKHGHLEIWESGSKKTKEIRMKLLRMKIRHAKNVGRVLISKKKSTPVSSRRLDAKRHYVI